MGKPDQDSAAAEGARRATGDAVGRGRGGRFSVGRKREGVLRLLRGEDLESVSRELGITAARASQVGPPAPFQALTEERFTAYWACGVAKNQVLGLGASLQPLCNLFLRI